VAAALALALAVVAWGSSGRLRTQTAVGSRPADRSAPALHVPRVAGAITINAETEGKTVWDGEGGNTGNLKDAAGQGMVPYTQAKVRWGDGKLYFMLYAGDLDLEGTVKDPDVPLDRDDSFRLEFGEGDRVRVVSVSVLGTLYDALCSGSAGAAPCDTGWQSHATIAVDRDGTLNKTGDNDEEWVVEMAIPLSDLGVSGARPGTRIPWSIRRCEVGYDGVHACGSWGAGQPKGELVLDP
jgi:hypothetical protein